MMVLHIGNGETVLMLPGTCVNVTADTVICGTPDSPCILPKGGVI